MLFLLQIFSYCTIGKEENYIPDEEQVVHLVLGNVKMIMTCENMCIWKVVVVASVTEFGSG
jgi:hypothetical protein